MAMVCPQCNTTYEQRWQCPLCMTRLLFYDVRSPADSPLERSLRGRQQLWERIFIGLVLAQGLFYGLRHLVTAGVLAIQGREAVEQMKTVAGGVFLLQGLRMFALFVSTVFMGAGQRQGGILGALIGVWNGVFSVFLFADFPQVRTPAAILGQPLLQGVLGAVGGWLGSAVWRPLSATDLAPSEAPLSRRRPLLRRNSDLFRGPVAWVRVVAGTILAVAGTLTATLVFDKILDIGQGRLATSDELQDRLITLEIKALALLCGGVLAGAATRNGLKQGFCVGLASTFILISIEIRYVEHGLQMAGYTALAACSLSLVGGWFGSRLFPPVFRKPRRRGRGNASLG